MQPGVNLIVCNYRTPSDLEGFLQSYEAYAVTADVACDLEIVNVCPGVEDERVADEWAQRLESVVGVTTHVDNVGYARACNHSAAHGDRWFLGLLNADVRIQPGSLERVLAYAAMNPQAAVIGPKQVDDSNRLVHAGITGTNDEPRLRGWMEPDRGQYDHVLTDVVTVAGSAYFVRRSAWDDLTSCPLYRQVAPDALGAFLPTQHYYEETFCSYHARFHGWECVYLGTTSMVHRWHQASPLGGPADQLFNESRQYFRDACDAHSILHD